jgi:hypothetical protein
MSHASRCLPAFLAAAPLFFIASGFSVSTPFKSVCQQESKGVQLRCNFRIVGCNDALYLGNILFTNGTLAKPLHDVPNVFETGLEPWLRV